MNASARLERSRARFWGRVKAGYQSDCWPWLLKPRDPFGYGGFHFEGRTQAAHRVAWMLTIGAIPEGVCVLHRCDNPPCCNPEHLFLGTKADNAADRHAKGRTDWAVGENQGSAKLIAADIVEIRAACALGVTHREMAYLYGVSRSNIGSIVNRKGWSHV